MTDPLLAGLAYQLTRHPLPSPPMVGPQEAIVVSSTATGVQVTVPVFSPDYKFGPAPYQPPVSGALPPQGTRCLVAFVGTDLTRPYVLMFIGWHG